MNSITTFTFFVLFLLNTSYGALTINLDAGSFVGNGTFSEAVNSDVTISESSLGSLTGDFDVQGGDGGQTNFEMKYQVFGGGSLTLSTGNPGQSFVFSTVGTVTGFEFEFFYGNQFGRRFTNRVVGFSLNQRTGTVNGSAVGTYYRGDGTLAEVSDAVTDGSGTIDAADIFGVSATDDLTGLNGTVGAQGQFTTNDLLNADEAITNGAESYLARFGVVAGQAGFFLGGQELTVSSNGAPFDAGTQFSFTIDGNTDNTTVTPFESTINVPEPSSIILACLGSIVGISRRKRAAH